MRESVESLSALSKFLRVFPDTATQLLRDAEQGKLTLQVEPRGLDELVTAYRRAEARRSRALGFGACVIAGALTVGHVGSGWAGVSVVSWLLWTFGLVLGFPLLRGVLPGGKRR